MRPTYETASAGVRGAYGGVTEFATGLTDDDLMRPSRCRGWAVADVLFHLLCDAQRALVALATPAAGPPDVDHVSYWASFQPGRPGAAGHAWWVRRSAAAFERPSGIVGVWRETAPAAARAAALANPDGYVATQGHVLAVPDFLATLVTEAVVHHLDMAVDMPGAKPPSREALGVALCTMDGLLDGGRPGLWTPEDYLLKATGRVELDERDRAALGDVADRFPLLG
ncbi:MAG TPA: maleylpyruvate isomerase N-terminal domain-containing protein [Micromonosporaceae bacterium]